MPGVEPCRAGPLPFIEGVVVALERLAETWCIIGGDGMMICACGVKYAGTCDGGGAVAW